MSKRKAAEIDANVENTREIKKQCVVIKDLFFLFFTAASCSGLCQGCDLCHPEECAPEEANAIRKAGTIYKQIGRGFDLTFASLTCLFIRMRASFKRHWTPTARLEHRGRLIVSITDDYGNVMKAQALKFASLAWDKLTPLLGQDRDRTWSNLWFFERIVPYLCTTNERKRCGHNPVRDRWCAT